MTSCSSCSDFAAAERATIRGLADRGVPLPDSITLRSELGAAPAGGRDRRDHRGIGRRRGSFARRRRTGVYRTIRMPVFDRFQSVKREAMPAAYLVPPEHAPLAELLRRHGVRVLRLAAPWEGPAEAFRIDSLSASAGSLRGPPRSSRRGGMAGQARDSAGAGWFLVPTSQRLGLLAAYLLEPASEDGFATWNLLDRDLRRGRDAPIFRVRQLPAVRGTELP